MELAVALDHISFAYQDSLVLKDICLAVKSGEFIGMIGPNGGGKTTLLKLMMGFLKPSSGDISIFSEPPASSLQQISYVPQSLRFDKQFPISVMELVMGGRLSHLPWYGIFSKKDKEIALHALERVGLVDFQHRSFGNLSGGQAQRALIARALASEPQLLLLDEPTASVDAQAESDIYNILKGLQSQITIIMVTHNLRAAIELVERVICVQQTAISLKPQEVCEHFAFGLYHAPLINIKS
ncbi:MAG: ABC transporter ATP-binding protein [Parachlamydiaceae bacterium]|nr:ABC transporter ATP-binding protein [Parachlamydiaceae bacterium]